MRTIQLSEKNFSALALLLAEEWVGHAMRLACPDYVIWPHTSSREWPKWRRGLERKKATAAALWFTATEVDLPEIDAGRYLDDVPRLGGFRLNLDNRNAYRRELIDALTANLKEKVA